MKKLSIIAGTILTILIILFLVAMLSINSIVKSGIEEIGTEMTILSSVGIRVVYII